MKKMILIFAGMFSLLFLVEKVQAQDTDYFVGKWEIVVTGTPGGDSKSTFVLERKDGKLGGTMDTPGKPSVNFTRVEEKDNTITAYFTSASGYDVYLFLEKADDNKATGSMMDMFDATATRIVETK